MLNEIQTHEWHAEFSSEIQSLSINTIENGHILFFPRLAFTLLPHEEKFLSSRYSDPKIKNISFNRNTHLLRGVCSEDNICNELTEMMRRFACYAEKLIQNLLSSYSPSLCIGRTSFRPMEISGRISSYRKDDTRLHVDAFPATPNQGRRILRVFTNINPHGQARVWRIGEPFVDVAKRFLPRVSNAWKGKARLLKMLKITKSYRTEYDHIMLQIHDKMKADLIYQQTVPQTEVRFAPGTSWIVQTDHVSHAAMAGQYVLEQTFYLPVSAMINPALSPLHTLEKLVGRKLVNSHAERTIVC